MFDEKTLAKVVGVLAGTLLSLVMVAPASTRNAFYRIFFGGLGGVIFTPVTQALIPVFRGESFEILVAASAATGFTCWFVLEFIARIMSSRNTLARLLEEVLKLKGIVVEIDAEDKAGNKAHVEVTKTEKS